jgi:hypothetical protein
MVKAIRFLVYVGVVIAGSELFVPKGIFQHSSIKIALYFLFVILGLLLASLLFDKLELKIKKKKRYQSDFESK